MDVLIYKDYNGIHIISDSIVFEASRCKHDYLIIDSSELPNRDFRNAWDIIDGKVVVDINKAKDIHRQNILNKMKHEFEKLDIQFLRALEDGADTTEIITRKKELRAKLSNIDACKTIDEIKKIEV